MCFFSLNEVTKISILEPTYAPCTTIFLQCQKQHVTKYHYKDNLVVMHACLYAIIETEANNNVFFTTTHTYIKVIYERDKRCFNPFG
jgi:hypothetical protein